jgi:acetyl esterase/lipase
MDQLTRVDPELLPVLEAFPANLINLHDIAGTRAAFESMVSDAIVAQPQVEGVEVQQLVAPCPPDTRGVKLRMYRPAACQRIPPALLWMHGGGYVFGSLDDDDGSLREMANQTGCAIISVDYRLAPNHPFPAALEDCYAALRWVFENAQGLGIDPSRICVGGASAGGGLAAALALLARDRAEVNVHFQLLIYPMIDDRNVAPADATTPDTLIWSRESNRLGWKAYLGDGEGASADVPPYAAVTRAPDVSQLPPAYIAVGELDLFLDEDIAYARGLMAAGVPAELHVYPGAFHGFDGLAPLARISRRFKADRNSALTRATGEGPGCGSLSQKSNAKMGSP